MNSSFSANERASFESAQEPTQETAISETGFYSQSESAEFVIPRWDFPMPSTCPLFSLRKNAVYLLNRFLFSKFL
jgi:hypothetical protein